MESQTRRQRSLASTWNPSAVVHKIDPKRSCSVAIKCRVNGTVNPRQTVPKRTAANGGEKDFDAPAALLTRDQRRRRERCIVCTAQHETCKRLPIARRR